MDELPGGELGADVAGALEDEGMVPIAVEPMTALQTLVDEKGAVEGHGSEDRGLERRILVISDRVVEPTENELTPTPGRAVVQPPRPSLKMRRQQSRSL